MIRDPLTILLSLGLTALMALGVLWLMLRVQKAPRGPDLVRGYPPERFPAQDLTRSGPLASLAMTQTRLLAVYAQLPTHSEGAVWLNSFLGELRQVMDVAYRAAGIAQHYGGSARLDRLAAEVQAVESQLAERLVKRALRNDGDLDEAELDSRLAVLRGCVRELGP